MRPLSFILAVVIMLVGPPLANSSDVGLPGIGTFAYNGSPLLDMAAPIVVVAAR